MAMQAQELGYRKFLSEGKCWYQHAAYHCSEDTTYHCAMYEVGRKVMYIPEDEKTFFDLQGLPVATPQKNGLFIKNGKKFIAR